MTWEGWITVITVAVMILALVRGLASTDVVFVIGLTVLVTAGVLTGSAMLPTPDKAVSGFGNEALVTVAVLYVVAAGLTQTGAMERLTAPLLGRPTRPFQAQSRLMAICASMSAFLNNTPIVAMFVPVLSDLCKKTGISPSKVFIPLSYATILGGICTLIGTSTNMVAHGLLKAQDGVGLSMFDITPIGVPVAVAGVLFVLIASRWLLPERKSALNRASDPRAYTVEMTVEDQSVLAGKSIEAAGLRGLPGLYLVEIERRGRLMTAVAPHEVLEVSDRLVFVGVVESVVDLQKMRGLKPATNQIFKIGGERAQRTLIEAVVAPSCPLLGKTIKEGRFRNVYNAAVIAVGRDGERINKKIGEIELKVGDTLLLEAHPSFAERMRDARDFLLVSRVEGSTPPRHERAWVAIGLMLAMVLAAGFEWLSMLNAGLIAATAMILTRCCSVNEARKSIEWDVVITIGAALGLGKAMDSTGAARTMAEVLIGGAATPWVALAIIYLVTMVLTEVMSNSAAVSLVFPIAMATAASFGASVMPFVIVIMVAGSCGFATPIGYQTNLMVYGPGGYKFADYLRIGVPLDLLCFAVAVGITPLVYPFHP